MVNYESTGMRVAGAVPSVTDTNARASSGWIRAATSLATLAFACATASVQAGTNTWTTNGPYGGLVTVLAVDPQTPANLYAAGFSGVFKSSNGGASWARASNGIISPSVDAIAIDPVTPSTLYAGSAQGGVAKSIDGAATWTVLSGTNAPSLVVALAVDPKTPSTVYASRNQGGISKSTDGGTTWNKVGVATLPSFPTFKSLVVDPVTPATIYAGDQSNGVYKSVDGGATWSASNTGMTGPIFQILTLAIDPQTTSTLYAAANTSGGSGLFKSTDSGAHWTQIANGNVATYNFFIQTVSVDPQTPAILYLGTGNGTFKSVDGGTSFAPIHSGMPTRFVEVIAINPANSSTLYAGTIDGIFATTNSGALWTAANSGLALTTVTAVAVDPATPATIYAGTSLSGLFKSSDGGGSWASINTGIGSSGNSACLVPIYTALAIDAVTPTTLYASSSCTESSGVYKSVDGGAHWQVAATGLPLFGAITALAIDPLSSSTLYAGTGGFGIYVSTDAGGTWNAAPGTSGAPVTGLSVAVIPGAASSARATTSGRPTANVASSMAAASFDGADGIFITRDHFKTEEVVKMPDCFKELADLMLLKHSYSLQIAAESLFAACVSPYAKRNPDGSFTNRNGETIVVTGFAAPPGSGDLWGARTRSTRPAGNAQPDPQVVSWAPPNGVDSDTAACAPVLSLIGNPLDATGGSFYAGAACGVLSGINLGQKIVTLSKGLPPNMQINAVAVTPAGDRLYAAAASGGVYQYTLGSQPATQLAFADINSGLSPSAGVKFDVLVRATAADLSAQNVAGSTTVQLSLASGVGMLGGPLSCQIPSGSSSCTITGVTYSVADTDVVLTATRAVGDALTPSDSPPFDVGAAQAPTQLTITSVNGGTDPLPGVPFNVVVLAMADDASPQNVVAATSVQLSVGTGIGTLGGTTTCQILAGSSTCTVVGATYSQADTNVVLTATRTAGDTLAAGNSFPFDVGSVIVPPSLVSAVSRRVHGSAGTFDLPLSLVVPPAVNHSPTTEPRQGPAQTIVFTFDKAISGATATVTEGTATAGTATFSGNSVIVPLTGVSDMQYVTVTLSAVASTDGGTGGAGVARVGFLRGDVNQNRVVSVADLAFVNAQVAQAVTAANFLKDINASGTLSVADKALTNANLTRALPTP